jgi:ribose 5-phosphate isomerase B
MIIYLATDHKGFELKEKIKEWLKEWGHEYEDIGATVHDESDDYPDFVHKAAERVAANPDEAKAIILGASGQGEAITANRHKNVRAVVYYGGTSEIVTLSRQHNDANMLSIGASFVKEEEAKEMIRLWLSTAFSDDERHKRRILKIDQ